MPPPSRAARRAPSRKEMCKVRLHNLDALRKRAWSMAILNEQMVKQRLDAAVESGALDQIGVILVAHAEAQAALFARCAQDVASRTLELEM